MKVFITGGAGNIGQYVTLAAAKKEHDVVVLSRTPEKYSGLAKMNPRIKIVQGFINEYDKIAEYVEDCDAVIHIALGWGNEPVTMCMEDTVPTINLMEISEKAGVERFIYTSSTAVLGHYESDMEESLAVSPTGLYGSTKAAAEAYILGFREYGAESGTIGEEVTMLRNIIRPGYTFSNPPYEGGSSQLDRRFRDITDAIVKGYPIQLVKNDGTQFLSAEQIAEVYIAILENGDMTGEIFFALGNTYITWERIAQIALEEHPKSNSTIELYDKGYGETPMMFSVKKMKDVLGLEFSGEDAVREHIKWNLEQSLKKMNTSS
ncbi:MAG: NAD(P)-dependent oxidoreductase [Oscillospiraceae bacterium]|nr:NAD(P)-dependent oxidoreductase [Oscillospiraceae bacterium]